MQPVIGNPLHVVIVQRVAQWLAVAAGYFSVA